jgi:hypothetical protein
MRKSSGISRKFRPAPKIRWLIPLRNPAKQRREQREGQHGTRYCAVDVPPPQRAEKRAWDHHPKSTEKRLLDHSRAAHH